MRVKVYLWPAFGIRIRRGILFGGGTYLAIILRQSQSHKN